MPSNKPQLKAVVDFTDYEKFKSIAESENRTVSNLLQTLIKDKIKNYESEHGAISIKNLNVVDNRGSINNINM